ncbi:hypothetical protein PPTG_22938 [Phytophthora nicotianae INRA-310]|uniref:Integrase catalytic domain-containing protein n=1 Tax=Phytophthora nicotianae (strain INRA-310) TaxID=761204 RepID=W2Q6Y7_PHYN3|nr:hypothetical protein PPTG_22938 [Phytophthora nicotianae INRA-310]ETN08626.1 hypothetical protein PPTG_22938 [Phytophthora nicotianae INRA-310]
MRLPQIRSKRAIRRDREPGFMSDFFRAFNRIVGQSLRTTMAYRPQAQRYGRTDGPDSD